jgi:Flp pilus assembly protein CpaB
MRPRSGHRSRRPVLPPIPWRRWLRRARRAGAAWWALAAIGSVVGAAHLAAADAAADAERDAWGRSVPVAIATHDLGPGSVVHPDDATVEQRPAAVVPDGALDAVPVGDVVTAPVLAGEALVAGRVGGDGLSVVAARVPAGHRAVAIPIDRPGSAPPLRPGDLVDVLATFDVLDPADTAPTGVVASAAVVVAVDDSTVTVAVPADDVDRVAFAVARGTVTLALVGAG